jgi:hypothetical protein
VVTEAILQDSASAARERRNIGEIYRCFDMGDNIFRQQAKAATSEVTPSKLD